MPSDDEDSGIDEEWPEEEGKQDRGSLRWLHAGLFKDAKGTTKDIWFAFEKFSRTKPRIRRGYTIVYASDWNGTPWSNLQGGRNKMDMITWDRHHAEKWEKKYITARGTWEYKRIMVGRAARRASLLRTWLDPNSPNIHAHGKDQNRVLGPPVNVIHSIDDKSGPAPAITRILANNNRILSPVPCYDGTNIPFSTATIKIGLFKKEHVDPTKVVGNFLQGHMAVSAKFANRRRELNDCIESAFYDCGWRVNRAALEKANDEMSRETIDNAFQSKAWKSARPLWVDRFKGADLDAMMKDIEGNQRGRRGRGSRPPHNGAGKNGTDGDDDSSEGDDVLDDPDLFVPRSAGPIKHAGARTEERDASGPAGGYGSDDDIANALLAAIARGSVGNAAMDVDEGLDYLPDNSRRKGKGPAKKRSQVMQSIEIDDDDEEADDDEDEIMIDEERSAPPQRLTSAPPQRMKSEAPEVVRSPGLNDVFDEIKADIDLQGGVVGEAVDAGSESDIEIDEIRSAPRAVKTEPAEPVVIKLDDDDEEV